MPTAVRVVVSGRVQGVGYRAYVAREAGALQVRGWVRNRRDSTVEAVLAGDDAAVERLLDLLRVGPPAADVRELRTTPHEGAVEPGFTTLPTA